MNPHGGSSGGTIAVVHGVNISALSNILPSLFQTGMSSSNANRSNAASPVSTSLAQDASSTISPLANFLSQLQQLDQQNPTEFKQVAANIGQQLTTEATAAEAQGNTAQANQLNQLASVFNSSAQTGQVPNAQQLQQGGFSGHHHHHHHGGGFSSQTNPFDPTSAASGSAVNGSSTDASLQTLLANALNSVGASITTQPS